MELIWGRNPVFEALRGRRRVHRVYIAEGVRPSAEITRLLDLAARCTVPLERLPRTELDRLLHRSDHQGVAAAVDPYPYVDFDELLPAPGEPDPLYLALDELKDPQNFGTLLRTAEAVQVRGVVLPFHRSVEVTGAVCKASAGAVEHLLISRVTNLVRALEQLKEAGVWIFGLEAGGPDAFDRIDWDLPVCIVVGSEGEGLRRVVRQRCDRLVSLPMAGKINSLNAAVAGSIVLYHAWRWRTRVGQKSSSEVASRGPGLAGFQTLS
jgi:23S rRNA (guanosine2251-2'-O)-methyltransferase